MIKSCGWVGGVGWVGWVAYKILVTSPEAKFLFSFLGPFWGLGFGLGLGLGLVNFKLDLTLLYMSSL